MGSYDRVAAGCPLHGAADGDPGADLAGSVARLHESVNGHVEQAVGQRLAFQFLEE